MARVAVVGLGKLGACLMAVMSMKHKVVGVDLNGATVEKLAKGIAPVLEPRLQELLTANRKRYQVATDYSAVADTDISFVIVPTPSDSSTARFSTGYVEKAVSEIGKAIKKKKGGHMVVIVSTVMPGATLGSIARTLRLNAGWNVPICYQPEFVTLGDVVNGMLYPDMLLIGAETVESGDLLEDILLSVTLKQPPVARLTIPEAEITKLAVNCYVTTKISVANTLAEVCEGIQNVDAQNVTAALGLDSRIGSKYLQPATSFGGTCFPRDGKAFLAFVQSITACAPITEATIDVNDRQVGRVANLLEKVTQWGEPIGVLGMSYKPNTPVIEQSIGTLVAAEMTDRGFSVVVYDPLALDDVEYVYKTAFGYASSVDELVGRSTTVLIAQPCDEFREVENYLDDVVVVDLWNLLGSNRTLRPGIYRWGLP